MDSPPAPLVRRVIPTDGPALRAQRLEMIADTPIAYVETLAGALAHPASYWTQQAAELAGGAQQAKFQAIDGSGAFVGTAGGYASDDGRTGVFGVFISPPYRGRGLLARLVDAVAAWSLECGRPELVLEVAIENPRAVRAYERIGFALTGETRPHPLYPEVTEAEMARPARWPA